jgi:hypothetical protein
VATNLEVPIEIPPRIVAPERDVPGINDNTWNKTYFKSSFIWQIVKVSYSWVFTFEVIFDDDEKNTINQ